MQRRIVAKLRKPSSKLSKSHVQSKIKNSGPCLFDTKKTRRIKKVTKKRRLGKIHRQSG